MQVTPRTGTRPWPSTGPQAASSATQRLRPSLTPSTSKSRTQSSAAVVNRKTNPQKYVGTASEESFVVVVVVFFFFLPCLLSVFGVCVFVLFCFVCLGLFWGEGGEGGVHPYEYCVDVCN